MAIMNTEQKAKVLSNVDLSVDLGGFKLKNPIMTASGTYGYVDEFQNYVDVSRLGAVITKGVSLNPRAGNPQPRLQEVNSGLINCIGLENVGVRRFIDEKLPELKKKHIEFVMNVAGFSFDEYMVMAEICEAEKIKAIELNVSCPNVKAGCLEFGTCPNALHKLVTSFRKKYNGFLIVKLTPNVTNPAELAVQVEKAGANAISAINTVKSMAVNVDVRDGKITRQITRGGLSGPAIKSIALNYIYTISSQVNIPIIGVGGISNLQDMIEFFAVGAKAVQIGTANFVNPSITGELIDQLAQFLNENGYSSLEEFLQGV